MALVAFYLGKKVVIVGVTAMGIQPNEAKKKL